MTLQILVADDSTPIQKVIKIAFSKHQTLILTAGSLAEAAKIIETEAIDLVVADSSLPGSKSPEDFKRLRGPQGTIPVVMLTGSYDSIREADLKMAGFESVIKKPFDASDLVSVSEALIGPKSTVGSQGSQDGLPNTVGLPSTHSSQNDRGASPAASTSSNAATMTQTMRSSIPLPPPPPVSARSVPIADNFAQSEMPQPFSSKSASPQVKTPPQEDKGLGIPSFLLDDVGAASSPGAPTTQTVPHSHIVIPENKGRPAFEPTLEQSMELNSFSIPPILKKDVGDSVKQGPSMASSQSSDFEDALLKKIQSKLGLEFKSDLRNEIQNDLRVLVEQYCREHFKSVAKEVLTQEIRRLADEKAKYLVDH